MWEPVKSVAVVVDKGHYGWGDGLTGKEEETDNSGQVYRTEDSE